MAPRPEIHPCPARLVARTLHLPLPLVTQLAGATNPLSMCYLISLVIAPFATTISLADGVLMGTAEGCWRSVRRALRENRCVRVRQSGRASGLRHLGSTASRLRWAGRPRRLQRVLQGQVPPVNQQRPNLRFERCTRSGGVLGFCRLSTHYGAFPAIGSFGSSSYVAERQWYCVKYHEQQREACLKSD